MATGTLVVHRCLCVGPVEFPELEETHALFKVFDNNLLEVPDDKLLFAVFNDLEWVGPLFKRF